MWSVGVITYVLLCGFSPFLSSTQTGLFEKIIKVEYDFPDPEWTNISKEGNQSISPIPQFPSPFLLDPLLSLPFPTSSLFSIPLLSSNTLAKDFIRHLLVKDPEDRYPATKCLDHPWLNGQTGTGKSLADGQISDKMKSYNEQRKATKKTI